MWSSSKKDQLLCTMKIKGECHSLPFRAQLPFWLSGHSSALGRRTKKEKKEEREKERKRKEKKKKKKREKATKNVPILTKAVISLSEALYLSAVNGRQYISTMQRQHAEATHRGNNSSHEIIIASTALPSNQKTQSKDSHPGVLL